AHDGAAHRIPHIHEGERAGRVGTYAFHRRAARPERGEVVTDAATLLHGEGCFAQMVEDAAHVVRDRAHDEAVEERDIPVGAGAGADAAGRPEPESLQRLVETLLPMVAIALRRGERAYHPAPAVLHRFVDGGAVVLEPV